MPKRIMRPSDLMLPFMRQINRIRSRNGVNIPELTSRLSKDGMREKIRHERRIELAFEEHRFYDVRRWMIASETENEPAYGMDITKAGDGTFFYKRKVALQGRRFQERNLWLPIPRSEILASDNKLEQNPGYN